MLEISALSPRIHCIQTCRSFFLPSYGAPTLNFQLQDEHATTYNFGILSGDIIFCSKAAQPPTQCRKTVQTSKTDEGEQEFTSDPAGGTDYASISAGKCSAKIGTGTRPTRDVAAIRSDQLKDTTIYRYCQAIIRSQFGCWGGYDLFL